MIDPEGDEGGYRKNDLSRTLLVSLLFHALILPIVLIPTLPKPKLTFGPIYSVELVSFADSAQTAVSSGIPSEFTAPSVAPRMEVFRQRVAQTAIPLKPVEVAKKTPSDIDRAVENLRHRDNTPPSSAPAAAERSTASPSNAPGHAGEGNKMQAYLAHIRARVKGQWAVPAASIPKRDIETIIDVQINRSGAITSISFEKRSGDRYFDESAMKAVRKASPFPPFPEGYTDRVIEVGIVFPSRELH